MNLSTKIFLEKNLLLILAAAFILRFIGIWYGLPSLYNSDEPFNVVNALAFGAKKSLEPVYFVYPTFYFYFLFGIYGLYFLFGKVFGLFETALDFGATYFLNPTGLFLVGRFVSVILGVSTIWMVYKIGQRFFSKKIGLLSAIILALSFTHVDVSHWILLEPALGLMSALAIYLIFRFNENPSIKINILASLVSGLAISTKYNAGFICLPLILSFIFIYKKDLEKLFINVGLSAVSIVFAFLIGTPYWIISFSSFLHDLKYTWAHVGTGMIGHVSLIPLVWPLWELVLNDWTVGFLFIAGFFYGFFHREKKQILLLSFVLPTILFIGAWNRTGINYLMPIFSALAVLAAIFLNDISQQIHKKSLRVAIVTLLFLIPLIKILYCDIRLIHRDTRTLAEDWIESNIPEGSVIGYENYVYGPNLFDPARFFKNSTESQLIPFELKERLLIERRKRVSYKLINFRKDFKPRKFSNIHDKNSIINNPYFRQILEHTLPTLSKLQNSGVEYLMISSDNYGRYLKKISLKRESPLWFGYQNSRIFYQNILTSRDLVLLREFQTSFWNLGPTLEVYKFKSKFNDTKSSDRK